MHPAGLVIGKTKTSTKLGGRALRSDREAILLPKRGDHPTTNTARHTTRKPPAQAKAIRVFLHSPQTPSFPPIPVDVHDPSRHVQLRKRQFLHHFRLLLLLLLPPDVTTRPTSHEPCPCGTLALNQRPCRARAGGGVLGVANYGIGWVDTRWARRHGRCGGRGGVLRRGAGRRRSIHGTF